MLLELRDPPGLRKALGVEVLRAVQRTYPSLHTVKRKIEKFVANTVVIKNPVPDELVKNP